MGKRSDVAGNGVHDNTGGTTVVAPFESCLWAWTLVGLLEMNWTPLIEQLLLQFAVDLFFILYVGFFALHAVQRIADPIERLWWVLIIVSANVFGATLYMLTKYRKFRAVGKGGFICATDRRWRWPKEYFCLSAAESAVISN
jgi:hypothetical protein